MSVDLSDLSSLESSFFSLLSFFVLSRVKVRSRTTICRANYFIFTGRIMSNEANNVAIGQSKVIIIIKEILLASR